MTKNKKKLRRVERRYSVTKSAQTLVLAGMLLAGGVSGANAAAWATGNLAAGTVYDTTTPNEVTGTDVKFDAAGSVLFSTGLTITGASDGTVGKITVGNAASEILNIKSELNLTKNGSADAQLLLSANGASANLISADANAFTITGNDATNSKLTITNGTLTAYTNTGSFAGAVYTPGTVGALTLTGPMKAELGAQGIIKTSLLTLGANTTLATAADGASIHGNVNIANGTLDITSGDLTIKGVDGTGLGDVTLASNGTLTLASKTLTLGTLTVDKAATAVATGTLNLAALDSESTQDLTLNNGGTINFVNDTVNTAATLYQAAGTTKGLVLGNGGTLSAGELTLSGFDTTTSKALSATNGVSITADKLVMGSDILFGNASLSVDNTLTIRGSATDAPTADFIDHNITVTGNATANVGTLKLGDGANLGGGTSSKNIALAGATNGDSAILEVVSGPWTIGSVTVGTGGTTPAAGFGTIKVGGGSTVATLNATNVDLYGTAATDAVMKVGTSSQTATSTANITTLNVGIGTLYGEVDIEGASGYKSTLNVTTLNLDGKGQVNIKGHGTLSFNDDLTIDAGNLDATAGDKKISLVTDGTLHVNGTLALTGLAADYTSNHTGTVIANKVTLNTPGTHGYIQNTGTLTFLGTAAGESFLDAKNLTVQGSSTVNLGTGTVGYTTNGGTYANKVTANGGTLKVVDGNWTLSNATDGVTSSSAGGLTVAGGTLNVTKLTTGNGTGVIIGDGTGNGGGKLIVGSMTATGGGKVVINGTTAVLQTSWDQAIDKANNAYSEQKAILTSTKGSILLTDRTTYTLDDLANANKVNSGSGTLSGALVSSTGKLVNANGDVITEIKANDPDFGIIQGGLLETKLTQPTANTDVNIGATRQQNVGFESVDLNGGGLNIKNNSQFTVVGDIAGAGANKTITLGDSGNTGTLILGSELVEGSGGTISAGITTAASSGTNKVTLAKGDFTVQGGINKGTGTLNMEVAQGSLKATDAINITNLDMAGGSLATKATDAKGDLAVAGTLAMKNGASLEAGRNLTVAGLTMLADAGNVSLKAGNLLTTGAIDSITAQESSSVQLSAKKLAATGDVKLGAGSSLTTTSAGNDGASTINGNLAMAGAQGSVGDLTTSGSGLVTLTEGAALTVKGKLVANGAITVGSNAGAATLLVNELDLSNSSLFVDPAWIANEYNPSQVAVNKFTGDKINGNVGVGRNSQVTLGSDSPEWLSAQVQKLGGWKEDGITAALGIYAPQTLATGQNIVVDGLATVKPAFATTNTVDFKANSLLVVNAAGLGDKAALTAETAGTVTIADKAQLRVSGVQSGKTVTVLDNFSTININADKGWSQKEGNLSTDSHMLYGELNVDNTGKTITVDIKAHEAQSMFPKLSSGMAGLVNGFYAQGLYDVESRNAGIKFMSRATNADMMPNTEQAAATIEGAAQLAVVGAAPAMTLSAVQAGTSTVTTRTSFASPLMDSSKAVALHKDTDGTLSVDSGLSAGNGMKNGFGLWIMPLYQSNSAWGMKADGFKGGYKSDLGGVALGADYTVNDMFRFGLAFNIGGGYAESNGDFNKTENSFSFWGINAYGGWAMNNFGITADVGYTGNYNKLQQELPSAMGMSDIKSDVNSSAWTAGLRGEYKFATEALDIIPHVGVRYTGLTTDEYKAKSGGDTVFKVDQDFQSIWTFPIGVTLAKEIETGSGWIIRPQVDLGITPATGDVKAKSKARIPGVDGSAEMKMQVVDYMSYDGGVGLEMKKDNVSFGINYNIQASEHRTGHGVFGTFRYEF